MLASDGVSRKWTIVFCHFASEPAEAWYVPA